MAAKRQIMAAKRQILEQVRDLIYAAQLREDWRRDHLGCSILGHACDRFVWLSFRWALDPAHDGQQLRLFSRGDQEESRILDELRRGGAVLDEDPAHFKVGQTGHVGGQVDAIGTIPGVAGRVVVEVKTHSKNSFDRLVEKGVRSSKPQHYTQVQSYMLANKVERAVYIAVCKDDDRIHAELIEFNRTYAQGEIDRADMLVRRETPPEALPDPTIPPCVYTSREGKEYKCQFYGLCHGDQHPEKNCRTCIECSVRDDGTMACDLDGGAVLTPEKQRVGCGRHVTIPSVRSAFWSIAKVDEQARAITYQHADGRVYTDKGGDKGGPCSS